VRATTAEARDPRRDGTQLQVDSRPSGIIKPGQVGNCPEGEVFTAPGEVNGTFVVDGVVGGYLCQRYGAPCGHAEDHPMPITARCLHLQHTQCRMILGVTHREENSDPRVARSIGTNIGVTAP